MQFSQAGRAQFLTMSEEQNLGANGLDKTVDYSDHRENNLEHTLELICKRIENLETRINGKCAESSAEQTNASAPFCASSRRERSRPRDNISHTRQEVVDVDVFSSPDQAGNNLGPGVPAAESPVVSDLQERYGAIRSSVEKVTLPNCYKLHDSRTGIKREDQPVFNVLSKCGRYVETIVKLLSEVDEDKPLDLEPITTVLRANIEYLQDEYSALLVKGKFDSNTANLFRALSRGNSGFTQRNLENVRVAAELSSIHSRYNTPSRPSYPVRGFHNSTYNNVFRGGFQSRNRFDTFGGNRNRFPPQFGRGRGAPQYNHDSQDD